jgi:hypothetical protein
LSSLLPHTLPTTHPSTSSFPPPPPLLHDLPHMITPHTTHTLPVNITSSPPSHNNTLNNTSPLRPTSSTKPPSTLPYSTPLHPRLPLMTSTP